MDMFKEWDFLFVKSLGLSVVVSVQASGKTTILICKNEGVNHTNLF